MLSRVAGKALPTETLLSPFLDAQLPDGVGLIFKEEMVGWYFPGVSTPAPGRDGDLTIATRIPASGDPAGAVACKFDVQMTISDINEFVDGYEHEAQLKAPSRSVSSQATRPLLSHSMTPPVILITCASTL